MMRPKMTKWSGSTKSGGVFNLERAAWGAEALHAYWKHKEGKPYDPEEDMIGDLLSDLLHTAASIKADPMKLLERAKANYEAEINVED